MWQWLAMAAAAPAIAGHGAHTPVPLRIQAVPVVPKHRSLDLSLPPIDIPPDRPLAMDGMIVRESLAPNATLGLGIASLGRRSSGDFRPGQRTRRSHRPAVTFVLKF